MTTIDHLLIKLIGQNQDYTKSVLSKRDYEVMSSLTLNAATSFFITENQSKLLVKILRENANKLEDFKDEINEALTLGQWSKPFKKIEQVRKFYINTKNVEEPELLLDFTFSSQIKKLINDNSLVIDGFVQHIPGRLYRAELTEKNIVWFVDALRPFHFDIDETIKNYYTIIKSWSKSEVYDQYLLTNIKHPTFQKQITADLGLTTPIDQNIINDRSIRYQYFTENVKNPGENLIEYIANRQKSRVWVDNKEHGLAEVIKTLIDLKRLPVLVVFDNAIDQKSHENLENLVSALDANNIIDDIGIYFRLTNNEHGKLFNQLIADKKYNKPLSITTKVAGVQSGKIPKFFLKNAWQPMSIISMNTKMGLRHGKTSVYSNCCDLIVEYAEHPTMLEQRII